MLCYVVLILLMLLPSLVVFHIACFVFTLNHDKPGPLEQFFGGGGGGGLQVKRAEMGVREACPGKIFPDDAPLIAENATAVQITLANDEQMKIYRCPIDEA